MCAYRRCLDPVEILKKPASVGVGSRADTSNVLLPGRWKERSGWQNPVFALFSSNSNSFTQRRTAATMISASCRDKQPKVKSSTKRIAPRCFALQLLLPLSAAWIALSIAVPTISANNLDVSGPTGNPMVCPSWGITHEEIEKISIQVHVLLFLFG